MTEEEWLAGEDPTPLLDFVQDRTTGRRFRLLACGCYGLIHHDLTDPVCLTAVRAGEQFADDRAGVAEFAAAHHALRLVIPNAPLSPIGSDAMAAAFHASYLAPDVSTGDASDEAHRVVSFISAVTTARSVPKVLARRMPFRVARGMVIGCLRCIVGNPFRPITLDPSWLTSTVTILARTMYESRDFTAMPILADALQDSGCEDSQILSHCRGDLVHCRGCWLVDLLLEKN